VLTAKSAYGTEGVFAKFRNDVIQVPLAEDYEPAKSF
jgi:hypothetical protein